MSGGQRSEHIYELLSDLCQSITSNSEADLSEKQQRIIVRNISNFISMCPNALGSTLPYDESAILNKIVKKISGKKNYTFNEIHEENKNINSNDEKALVVKPTITKFYKAVEQLKASQLNPRVISSILGFLWSLENIDSESSSSSKIDRKKRPAQKLRLGDNYALEAMRLKLLSNSQSYHLQPMYSDNGSSCVYEEENKIKSHRRVLPEDSALSTPACSSSNLITIGNCGTSALSSQFNKLSLSSKPNLDDDIVQNIIYAFTGIQGKYLKKDIISGKFKLDIKTRSINIVQAGMLMRLSELGYYHDLVQSYTDNKRGLCALGLMGQGFVSALRNELTKFYGMVAVLQEQLNQQHSLGVNNYNKTKGLPQRNERLTLSKLLVWYVEPLKRLQWLAEIAKACTEKKGGALASTVHSFLNNGSPLVKSLAQQFLLAVCGPLYQMLTRWLLEGEVCDLNGEFFIECLSEVSKDRLWHDKYRVRYAMLPNFITSELAHKILVTGKNINFLCVICEDKQPVKGRDDLRQCIEKNPEDIFSCVADTKLHSIIDTIYLNTSKRVLDMVVGPHKLLDHLQAMRRYLLLGQGDFICSLMENLKLELDKPASELYSYDLSAIMDSAIRSTNAHYEDPEILNHLDVRLMSPCKGDVGWDILTLQYTVRGPLSTMLEPSMAIYRTLFKPLWRMKHMEFVLSSKIWKEQKCNAKLLREMSHELQTVVYRLHLFTSEMIHFIHQMEYYILFEVIECAWAELQERVQKAKALDEILYAHNDFLNAIKAGSFLDNDSENLSSNLENVYEGIVHLEIWQEKFYQLCFAELNARKSYKEEILLSEKREDFGLTNEKEFKRENEQKVFRQMLASIHSSLENIGADYEKAVRSFLMALNSHNDHNLQLFGIRLDFNEYYKKRDQSLGVPLTFERMRMSNVYNLNKSMYGSRLSQIK